MILIITASPNRDGLTAACAEAAMSGARAAGGEARMADLYAEGVRSCQTCGNGWGICRKERHCFIDDCLPSLIRRVSECGGLFLVTPVYWGQPSEPMQHFMSRFRRCQNTALSGEPGAARDKQTDLIAAAGGSGNGTVSCLAEMEAWCRHVGAVPKERIGVNRFNRAEMLGMIEKAAARMVTG
ncbi:MAG: flavodoxin family protein [Oscillospiraceae bacterium]|jgi:multimeric flavodoxin WrbA|nr:flavodoxin family protein [Oscillospiraceae bacterium]